MARKAVTTRWDPLAHNFVARAAGLTGISFNDFVIGAALVRAALVEAAENPGNAEELLRLYAEAGAKIDELGA